MACHIFIAFVLLMLLPPTVALSLPAGQNKAAGLPVKADEVRLKNGDRLTGEIFRMEKELLIFRTPYIDEKLSISWKEVACIVSDHSHSAQFKDNEFLIGRISCPEDGKIQIESGGGTQLLAVNTSTYAVLSNLGGSLVSGNTETNALNVATRFKVWTHKRKVQRLLR